ncbi:hypothetical protein HJP15_12345 [Pseudoalteromonas sp. NEC-BIFX-2020_002]|uniref:Uncharacterized protein n=1 Tax=Pseudoalteromonas neustonica TaxID=1840331 RepID=A0ABU9U5V6_9GAMM|nr:hypothetical protein [Pseudoalteromonas sp. NEC-BIFX-2020_002]NNG43699.1 hypothetical protein [Pseudoalteromonas sp. NEC-BIFX-2020_002]
MLSKSDKGQSSVEYLVITAALVFSLLMPVPDNELTSSNWLTQYQGKNVIEILGDKFKRAYNNYSYAKALPPLPDDF